MIDLFFDIWMVLIAIYLVYMFSLLIWAELKYHPKSYEFRTNITSYLKNGVVWQSWDAWYVDIKWSSFGYEEIYYDGYFYIWKFGIGTLCLTWGSNYQKKHSTARKSGV